MDSARLSVPRCIISALLVCAATVFGQPPPLKHQEKPPEAPPPEQEPATQEEPTTEIETTTPRSRYEQATDPGAAPRTRHKLLPHLYYGVKLELDTVYARNFDIDEAFEDDLVITEPQLSFALSYQPYPMLQVFANLRFQQEVALHEGADLPERDREAELELRDAFVSLREFLPGLSVQVGRQRFRDTREWLFDERLDAARLIYATDRERIEVSVSREDWWAQDLLHTGDEHDPEDVFNNYLIYASTRYRDRTIAGYVLVRDGQEDTIQNDIYYGVHSHGEITGDLEYWLEAVALRGRNGTFGNRSVAIDAGLTYEFRKVPGRPSLVVGYARGSGDPNQNDSADETFRQTGMQDNDARLNGVARVAYYGELLDPELSNLNIYTAGLGLRPSRRSSIDVVYHYYEQVEPNRRMGNTDLRRLRLTGLDEEVGHELDVVIGYREVKNLALELTFGYFLPGEAMPETASEAYLFAFQARYDF